MNLRRSMLGLLAITALTLTGCEDDPILQPQQGAKTGGSYSRITIDSAGTGHSGAMNKANPGAQANPERF